MRGKLLKSGLATAALLFGLSAATLAQAQDKFVRIGGGLAGTYPLFAAKLADVINSNIDGYRASVVSGNTEQSQIALDKGELEFNISYTYVTRQIYDGKASFGIPTPSARHVMTLYSSVLQTVAKTDGVDSLTELEKDAYRVWMGSKSGFFYQLAEPVLQAHGVEVDEISAAGGVVESFGYLDTVQAFQDGRLDVTFFAGPTPYGLLMQLENSPGFKVLNMPDSALSKLEAALPGMSRGVIPAGTYAGQSEDAHVPYFVNQLVSSTNVPDDLVYQVTKLMNENPEAFHGLFAGSDEIGANDPLSLNQIPVHPGAERYYKEAGKL